MNTILLTLVILWLEALDESLEILLRRQRLVARRNRDFLLVALRDHETITHIVQVGDIEKCMDQAMQVPPWESRILVLWKSQLNRFIPTGCIGAQDETGADERKSDRLRYDGRPIVAFAFPCTCGPRTVFAPDLSPSGGQAAMVLGPLGSETKLDFKRDPVRRI
jgi:hypothetical protein